MHRFSVWAPSATRVEVELSAGPGAPATVAMAQPGGRDGWWEAEVPGAGAGTDYAFHLDGGPARPDPRSAWQPHGVHGASRVVDLAARTWADGAWRGVDARGAVLYELHVGTFTPEGTLAAAQGHLDHLVALGVDVVELLPVAASPGTRGWGYDGVGLWAVQDAYGGPEALADFVEACHGRGLGVALDCVFNHLGPSGNYLAEFGPYFTDAHETPWGQAVNLDGAGSAEVRRFVVDAALRWFRDLHVDALRLDAVHALVDDSDEHLLAQLSRETAALSAELGRPLTLVAESDLNDTGVVTPLGQDSGTPVPARGMGAQWADDVHHALHALLTGERQGYYADFGSLAALSTTLRGAFLHDGGWSSFRGRDWGAPVDTARHGGRAFVAYTTTHDQTGNRATGDRLSATLDDAQLASAQAVVLTSAFTPMLFMGEEWGARTPWRFFTDHDAELGPLVSRGRAEEFAAHGWDADDVPDPQDPATRDASVLDWSEPAEPRGARLLAWTRDLVALRRAEADLRDDDLRAVGVVTSEDGADPVGPGAGAAGPWLVVQRGALQLAVNLADAPQEVPLEGLPDAVEVVLAWEPDQTRWAGGALSLPAHGCAVVRLL